MLLITANKSRQLLHVRFIGLVRAQEMADARAELAAEMGRLSPGFHYLVDCSQLESMALDCTPEVGRVMEMVAQAGVGLVVRVIPDPSKDIGLNILGIFHYPEQLKVINCQNLMEAARLLGLP